MVNHDPNGALALSHIVTVQTLTSSLTAATNAVTVDTRGFSYCTICAVLGANDYADADETMTFQLMEGAASNASDAADVTGITFGPCADTAYEGKTLALFSVKCGGARARYLSVDIDIAGTTPSFVVGLFAILSNPKESQVATALWTAQAIDPALPGEDIPI